MQNLQSFYPIQPALDGRFYIDSELDLIIKQLVQKPLIFPSADLIANLNSTNYDTAIPVGTLLKVGVTVVNNITGIAMLYEIQDEFLVLLKDAKLLDKVFLEPIIIGELNKIENNLFIDKSKVINIRFKKVDQDEVN